MAGAADGGVVTGVFFLASAAQVTDNKNNKGVNKPFQEQTTMCKLFCNCDCTANKIFTCAH